MSIRESALRDPWFVAVAAALLAACSENGVATPGDGAAADGGATVDAVATVDATKGADAGTDATSTFDGPVDANAPRDGDVRDLPGEVREDVEVRLEVPVDPLGVPAPGSECAGDGGVRVGDPTIAPPRPVLPQSVSRVTSQRPSFRWVLPEGTTGARVEVCADRCCTRVLQTLEAEGTTVRPTTALPPGVVYWRLFGRRAGVTGSRASYTREFGVRRRDTPVDSSWGTLRDFTGDGYDDLLILDTSAARVEPTFFVVEGGPSGPRPPRLYATVPDVPAAVSPSHIGDFNGDGSADLGYLGHGLSSDDSTGAYAIESRAGGTSRVVHLSVEEVFGARPWSIGVTDWNGDGYSDLLMTVVFWQTGRIGAVGSVLLVYRGSPTGLSERPQQMVRLASIFSRPEVDIIGDVGDVDRDGYGDIVVNDQTSTFVQGWTILSGRADDGLPRGRPFGGPESGIGPRAIFVIVTAVGDQDGDGLEEVVFRQSEDHSIYLYTGASGLMGATRSLVEPASGSDGYGHDVGGGDMNGDGFADLLVGSSFSAAGTWHDGGIPFNRGRMYVYFGERLGLGADPIWFGRVPPTDPDDNPEGFAVDVASTGDLNGDGIDDAAVFDGGRHTCCYVYGATGLVGARLEGCEPSPGYSFY